MASNPQTETIQFRIPASLKYVATIRRAIHSLARSLGFSEDMSEDIELSVAEAVTNAVVHGSPNSPRSPVVVACKVTDDNFVVDVRDEGPGFEPLACGEDSDSWKESGRGLKLIYRLMDNVCVSRTSRGSRIRMEKKKDTSVVAEV